MPFYIRSAPPFADGLILELEGDASQEMLHDLKKWGKEPKRNFFHIPSQKVFECLKKATLSGGLYFGDRRISADFFGPTHWDDENGAVKWKDKALPLKDMDLIGRGPPHWFIKGIVLKLLPEDLAWEEIKDAYSETKMPLPDPTPTVILTDQLGSFVNLAIDYGSERVLFDQEQKTDFQRKTSLEKGFEADLLEAGYIKKTVGQSAYYIPRDRAFEALKLLSDIGWRLETTSRERIRLLNAFQTAARETETEYFIEGNADFDGVPLDLTCLPQNETSLRVALKGKESGLLPEGWKKQLGSWWEEARVDKGKLTLPKNRLGLLQDAALLPSDSTPTRDVAVCIKGELRNYQKEGVAWLKSLHKSGFHGLLADDMGLGKTVQVLAFLSSLDTTLPHLIVAPASLVFNWRSEIERFLDKKVLVHHGKERIEKRALDEPAIVLTSYAMLRQDLPLFQNILWHTVVLDEAQNIKSLDSLAHRSACCLKSHFRISLTGTPIENHPDELFAQFQFLFPGLLGSKSDYQQDLTLGRGVLSRKKIRPFVLRRKKEEVAKDLPEKIEQAVWVEMEEAQKEVVDELLGNAHKLIEGSLIGPGKKMEALEAILRLRQAACDPRLLGKAAASAKWDALLEDMETIFEEGKKAIVFSQFTSFLDLLEKETQLRGWKSAMLTGKTKNREKEVEKFQEDPDVPFFLVSLKAGGVGLNLTRADYVLLYEPWWNSAAENQAIDRAHRIGRKDTVIVKRYLLTGSIEEKIERLKARKKNLSDFFLEEEAASMLTEDDLLFLLS